MSSVTDGLYQLLVGLYGPNLSLSDMLSKYYRETSGGPESNSLTDNISLNVGTITSPVFDNKCTAPFYFIDFV